MRPLLLALAMWGCEAADPIPILSDAEPPPGASFDAEPLRDGVVVRRDARLPFPDAAYIDDAGRPCRPGRIRGTVCAPNGQPIAGAEVAAATRSCQGEEITVTAVSGPEGRVELDGLAPGPTSVVISTGQFIARTEVEVVGGATVPLNDGNEKLCFSGDLAALAVVTGAYDRIEGILDGLELQYDLYCGVPGDHLPARRLLLDRERLAGYRAVFVNCGPGIDLRHTNRETERLIANLRDFVAGGGSLYVSDLAADFVESAWPEAVDLHFTPGQSTPAAVCCFCGPDCPDECAVAPDAPTGCGLGGSAGCGGAGVGGTGPSNVVAATIEAAWLREALGADTLDVVFDLGGWVEIDGVAAGTEVLVRSARRPLMVQFQPEGAAGRVTYTSFHNSAQATGPMRAILEALVFRL